MRIWLRGKQFAALALAGLVTATIVVVGGGQTVTPTTTPPTSWFGLLAEHGPGSTHARMFGVLLLGAVVALVLLWVAAIRAAQRGDLTERRMWTLGAVWAAPFAVGPPIISKDVHAYVAQGLLRYRGLDPYTTGVSALSQLHNVAADHALAAVDPRWQSSLSPYGPITTLLERVAAQITGGDAVGTLIVLRVMAVLSVLLLTVLAASLAGPRRIVGIACVLLNPLMLMHLVSGVHFEAEVSLLVLAGVLAAKRQSWTLAIVLVCAAGSVKAPAFAALPILIAAHVQQRAIDRRSVRTALQDVLVSAASSAVFGLTVPNGFGWLHNLSTPSQTATASPSALFVAIFKAVTPGTWAAGTKIVVSVLLVGVAAAIIGHLALTAGRRPLGVSVGAALVVLALLLPVFYPWYLLWGVLCLLVTAEEKHRDRLLALCGVVSVVGLTGTPSQVARIVDVLAIIAAALWLRHRRRSEPHKFRVEPDRRPRLSETHPVSSDSSPG